MFAPSVTAPSGWLHSEIWLWVTWGQETFGSDLPPGLSMFHWVMQTWGLKFYKSAVLFWCPTSCLLHLAYPKPTYEWGCLYPGSGWASCMRVQVCGLSSSVLSRLHRSLGVLGSSESLRGVTGDYFRRKRCASMAASSGLTGWASWPTRLTGGMLPNWRLVRKLLASWIVFFSSANSSCWRM